MTVTVWRGTTDGVSSPLHVRLDVSLGSDVSNGQSTYQKKRKEIELSSHHKEEEDERRYINQALQMCVHKVPGTRYMFQFHGHRVTVTVTFLHQF